MSGDRNIFIQRTSVTGIRAGGDVNVGGNLNIFQDGTGCNPKRQQQEVVRSLMSIAKQCYREEMDKHTATVLPVEAAELLDHHKAAVAVATRRVSGTIQLQNNITVQVSSVLQDTFQYIELINVKKRTAGKAIGIDFGTTLRCVAVCKEPNKPEIIPNDNDNNKTPSYVAFLDMSNSENDLEITCGETAKQQASSNPKGTIFDVKHMLGQTFSCSLIQQCVEYWPFDVVSENDQILIKPGRTAKRNFTPVQITAYLLRHLVKMAEEFMECPVVNAVIAVPVEVSAYQEMFIRDACELAHLNILKLVHEPTAASIAYNNVRDKTNPVESTHCVIIDFGGGTFDVAVLKIHEHRVHILGTGGDNCLGGNLIDANMAEYCIAKFKETRGVDLRKHQTAQDLATAETVSKYLRQLIVKCEDHKKVLSLKTKTLIYMDEILGTHSLSISITSEEFYSINAKIFERSIEIINNVLTGCNMNKLDVDEVVLVGGSSRIPVFRKMIKDFFQKEPLLKSVRVDEAVAAGAAILASEAFDLTIPSVLVPKFDATFEYSDSFDKIEKKNLKFFEVLGTGEYGCVYRGEWTQNGKTNIVAIKEIKSDVELQDKIMEGAKIQFSLHHPNIVSLFGICCLKTDLWIVMDFVDCESLKSILFQTDCAKTTELTMQQKLKLCSDMSKAISYIHQKGYVHCDIQPYNLMVDRKYEHLYVSNFHLSAFLGSMDPTTCPTQYTNSVTGTLFYLPPECLQPDVHTGMYRKPTFASDIWTLGLVFYEIFTTKHLYDHQMKFLQDKLSNKDSIVKKKIAGLPKSVRSIVFKCLDFSQTARPTAQQLCEFLHELQ